MSRIVRTSLRPYTMPMNYNKRWAVICISWLEFFASIFISRSRTRGNSQVLMRGISFEKFSKKEGRRRRCIVLQKVALCRLLSGTRLHITLGCQPVYFSRFCLLWRRSRHAREHRTMLLSLENVGGSFTSTKGRTFNFSSCECAFIGFSGKAVRGSANRPAWCRS